jgi:hypothetical protein
MVKYPLDDGRVGILRGDQVTARKFYQASLKASNDRHKRKGSPGPDSNQETVNLAEDVADLDPSEDFQEERVSPVDELKEVQIDDQPHQTTNLEPSEEKTQKIISICPSSSATRSIQKDSCTLNAALTSAGGQAKR